MKHNLLRRKAKLSGQKTHGDTRRHSSPIPYVPVRRDFQSTSFAIESALSLLKQLQRITSEQWDGDKRKRLTALIERELHSIAHALPKATVKPPPRVIPPPPRIAEMPEQLVTNLSCDTVLSVTKPYTWTRWRTEDGKVAIGWTHKIMPGLFRILATDGIRAIVCPHASREDDLQVIVHVTNLVKFYDPDEEEAKERKRQAKVATNILKYSLEDLI